jgi:ABC-type lipoprotein export system ATPase subunit
MMVLDEPTAGLDEHYLGCLADVLLRVNEVTKKRRQQIFMVTHDQRLERVFDQLIKFE